MKRAILVLSALAILLGGTRQANGAAINPAVEYSTVVTDFDGHAFTLGYKFTTSTTLDVNALGYWVDGQGNNHQVGIWNSVGGLLASTTVLSTDVVVGHFQYHSIPDLILAPGTYTIGGEFFGGIFPRSATGVVSIPGYTYVQDEQILGPGLNYPTVSSGGDYGSNGILAADFSVAGTTAVPEPATMTMLGIGIAGLAGYGWRRRKQAWAVRA